MTEIFTTSEGTVIAEEENGIYDPYCLVQDGIVSVPAVGGEWLPSVRLDN